MLNWLARRRFNYVDDFGAFMLGVAFATQHYWLFLVGIPFFTLFSVLIERAAIRTEAATACPTNEQSVRP